MASHSPTTPPPWPSTTPTQPPSKTPLETTAEDSDETTAQLDRVRQIAEQVEARVVLAGDPHQLAAVEAGGALSLLDGRAETTVEQAPPWDSDTFVITIKDSADVDVADDGDGWGW